MIVENNALYENIKFYDTFGHDGSLIRIGSTTCYRSEDTSKKDANGFIDMLKKSKHLSMLEMIWIPIKFELSNSIFSKIFNHNLLNNMMIMFDENKYLVYTLGDNSITVSGNGRAWLEFVDKMEHNYYNEKDFMKILVKIKFVLSTVNSKLFDYGITANEAQEKRYFKRVTVYHSNTSLIDEDDIHKWVFIKLINVSRGLTHELVRHRVMSIAQASSRYINNSNFDILFDIEEAFKNLTIPEKESLLNMNMDYLIKNKLYDLTESEQLRNIYETRDRLKQRLQNVITYTQELYSDMVLCGVQKNHARQILPTGILNEICVAGRITDWEHVFELRTSTAAHWEIREIAKLIQKIFRKNEL